MSEVMPQASAMDIHITVDAQGATSYVSDRDNTGVILDLKEKKEEEMDTDKIQPARGQNGVTLNTSYSSDETFLKKADHSYGGDNLPDHERMRNVHLDSEDDSQGSDTKDTYDTSVERNNTIVQIGDNSSVIYHSHNTFILNFSNSRPDNQGMAHETGHRNPSIPVNVTINTVLKLTSTSETSSSEHKGRRITGLHTRISVPDQPMVETAAFAEMQREGCFSRINNFFRNKLGNIFRGSIILDLSPDSVGSLHRILEVIKSGELNNLMLEILQKKEVLENISGTNLKVDIEIVVPEDVFVASGLTMTDIGDLPISKSQTPHGNKDNENIASGITATDHVKETIYFAGMKIINLVIIGKPGSGKSGLGNIIVGREAFPSKLSGSPVTQSCETMSTLRDAFMLQVIDTPGADGHEWQCERCTFYNSSHRTHCQVCVAQRPRQEPALPNVSNPHPLYSYEARPLYDGRIGWSGHVSPDNQRRIVFIGRTGSGKSATGNNILNKKAFESSACGSSVTKKCQRGTAKRFGRDIQIIDSPGLFDTDMEYIDITREVVKCVGMTAPGPHAFVLVVRIDRFTKEENETVQHFKQVFGQGMLNHLIILFTRKDDLANENKTLKEYLTKVPQDLQDLANACNNRCIAFNNRGSEDEREQDVQNFLSLVDSVVMDNGGNCYTSEMYVEAEKSMKKREEELKREHERRAEEERNAIRREYELKFRRQNKEQSDITKQMKKRIEELELEKTEQSKKNDSEADITLLCDEMKELKMALKGVEEEKKESDKTLQEERGRREREAEKRLEAEKEDFREQAREEVNKEKSGFMGFLGSVLPTLVSVVLPSIVPAAGKLLLKVFKK